MVKAALEIQDFLLHVKAERQSQGLPYFEARLGIHTGPVVAGVVGAKKFAYDIWGDTVNTAARMEESSEPGRVNVSENTYLLAKYEFEWQYRGKIAAKNKGQMDMYYVTSMKTY
jgi:class 3 adenylate cyclase